jgi:hypothetical protein
VIVGVPSEVKDNEFRVLTSGPVAEVHQLGWSPVSSRVPGAGDP